MYEVYEGEEDGRPTNKFIDDKLRKLIQNISYELRNVGKGSRNKRRISGDDPLNRPRVGSGDRLRVASGDQATSSNISTNRRRVGSGGSLSNLGIYLRP